MPSWAAFASRSFSSSTSVSRRATLACTAASLEMLREGDSAAKPVARKNDERVRLYSRPGNDLTDRFPLIVLRAHAGLAPWR
jgi:hypothetical protein